MATNTFSTSHSSKLAVSIDLKLGIYMLQYHTYQQNKKTFLVEAFDFNMFFWLHCGVKFISTNYRINSLITYLDSTIIWM